MKRFLILCAVATIFCTSAYGWGRREHAVVAKIAENHLTPKAKQYLYKYMHRRSLVYYANYANDYQPLNIDLSWQPSNAKRRVPFPHTFTVDENCKPCRDIRNGEAYVKNCLYFVDKWSQELKSNHAGMNDSVRMTHIALIVHAMGEIHSPVHIRYAHDSNLARFKIKYGKRVRTLHDLWDNGFVAATSSICSFSDFARYIDVDDGTDIEAICKGDVYVWGEESARESLPLLNYQPDENIDVVKFKRDNLEKGEMLLRKAGYRLAKVLNEIFE
ncbi:MAG: S1/P1 Nuclease [Rikenellaceae bacterium]|nr:S1/P1 Nuclease [Rikenellaceae bacterium]